MSKRRLGYEKWTKRCHPGMLVGISFADFSIRSDIFSNVAFWGAPGFNSYRFGRRSDTNSLHFCWFLSAPLDLSMRRPDFLKVQGHQSKPMFGMFLASSQVSFSATCSWTLDAIWVSMWHQNKGAPYQKTGNYWHFGGSQRSRPARALRGQKTTVRAQIVGISGRNPLCSRKCCSISLSSQKSANVFEMIW